jgi:hypothetical protein
MRRPRRGRHDNLIGNPRDPTFHRSGNSAVRDARKPLTPGIPEFRDPRKPGAMAQLTGHQMGGDRKRRGEHGVDALAFQELPTG